MGGAAMGGAAMGGAAMGGGAMGGAAMSAQPAADRRRLRIAAPPPIAGDLATMRGTAEMVISDLSLAEPAGLAA